MKTSDMTDRQLLEKIADDVDKLKAGQIGLNSKIDFVVEHTDEQFRKVNTRFDTVIETMQAGFTKNDAEHATMNARLSEHTASLARLVPEVKQLDVERLAIIRRQGRLEKLHR